MTRLSEEIWSALAEAAAGAARTSNRTTPLATRAPRGAAVLTQSGKIYSGPELSDEDAAGTSAERAALYRAIVAGHKKIRAVLIRGGKTGRSDGGAPTAATLQVLLEFGPRAEVRWGTTARPLGGETVSELLPGAFDRAHLLR